MGDELRGENLVHLNVRFSTETELKKIQDFLYEKSGQGVSFTGLVEAMVNEVTIVTAVHNIKSNKGSKTAGVDKIKMDKYLQLPKDELILCWKCWANLLDQTLYCCKPERLVPVKMAKPELLVPNENFSFQVHYGHSKGSPPNRGRQARNCTVYLEN